MDIQREDLIIYLNGNKINTMAELKAFYDAVPTGEEIKLGIQRGEEKMIRSFDKPDPENAAQGNGMVIRREVSGGAPMGLENLENRTPWPAGFLIGENDEGVVIGMSLPLPGKSEALEVINEGDVIDSLNDSRVETVAELLEIYDAIPVGDDVTLKVLRDGESISATFPRPENRELRIRMN